MSAPRSSEILMLSNLLLLSLQLASALPIPGWLLDDPVSDPFYQPPPNLADLQPGDVYNSREVQPDLQLSLAFASVSQIAYRTTNTEGKESHTIATVFQPLFPSFDNKLFSYQFWEDSDELNCSPSYSLVKGVLAPDQVTAILDTPVAIKYALSQGWAVVVPDHEGPNSGFIAGYEQGRAGLDGIRAALSFLGWDKKTPTALYGYSGGASATVWMANLHESYASELNIVGAAHGGTPVDLIETINWLDRPDRAFSGFIVGAIDGLLSVYPDLNETAWPHVEDSLKEKLIALKTPDNCILTEVLAYGFHEYHVDVDTDFFSFPPVNDVLHKESLLNNVSTGILSVPKFPRYIFHADGDEIIPAYAVRQYVSQQCAQGANIQYVPWLGNNHLSIEYLGLPDALKFVDEALNGNTPQVMCGTPNDDILTLASKLVGATLGQGIADILEGLTGFVYQGIKIAFDPDTPYQRGQLP